mgnify:CR=1 FL=1
MKKLTFTLLFALMAIVSAQAAKVYLKVAGFVTDNNTLTAYAWKTGTEDRLLGDWPGTKMALETIGADKYYVCEFDYDGEYSIIFKGTVYDKEQQSIDLTGNIGDCTFVANDNWKDGKWRCDKTEGAPSAETPVETYTVQLAGNAYGTGWDAPVTFAYNAETKEYVYEETETAKLADEFKINIVETNAWLSNNVFENAALNNELGFQDLYGDNKNMKITDAADYDKITLTVKNDNGTWKQKIVGEKPDKVQIKGVFNRWKVADMVSNPNGTYTYEVEENMKALSEGFGIVINGVFYAGNTVLVLDGDAVVLTGNPNGNNLTLFAEGDVASVILTVAKDGDNWTVKAATGKTSSVAGVDAAGVVIAAANGEIVVDGAQSVAVYTAAGALVSTDARTRVAAGLYIVRADNVVKKVIVK